MELDSQSLTHVAAIIVGVLVTLVLVSGFSNSNKTEAPVASANAGDASTGQGKNQKKKKKKKGKGGAVTEEATKAANKAAVALEEEEKKEEEAAAKPANGKKQKKKKAKKPANGNSKPAPATNGTENGGSKKENEAKAANTAPVFISPEEPGWQTPVVEEEWNDVVVSKKKNKRPKAPAAAATAAAPSALTSTDTVTVDAKKIGIIIGPKGATMIAIQAATGCTLDINAPDKDAKVSGPAPKATVAIAGPDKVSCLKAKQAVTELATKGYAKLLQADGFGEYSIQVHPRILSEIVGPGGKCIQALQKTLDVKVSIPPTEWKPNQVQAGKVKMCNVGIAGSKENSKLCKEAIKQLMEFHHSEVTHPGFIHEEVYVPQEFFHCVIGPRGSEIKHIKGNYKVDMFMPNANSDNENVVVVGKQANVDKAISYIQLLMDRDSEQKNQKYSDEYYGDE